PGDSAEPRSLAGAIGRDDRPAAPGTPGPRAAGCPGTPPPPTAQGARRHVVHPWLRRGRNRRVADAGDETGQPSGVAARSRRAEAGLTAAFSCGKILGIVDRE